MKKVPKSSNSSFRCECGKVYTARNSLWYHKKKCDYEPINEISVDNTNENNTINDNKIKKLEEENEISYKDMFLDMMKQNQELQKSMRDMIPNIGSNNNNINIIPLKIRVDCWRILYFSFWFAVLATNVLIAEGIPNEMLFIYPANPKMSAHIPKRVFPK